MTHIVAQPCCDGTYTDCVVVCPAEYFDEGERMLSIHADECIDREACVPECPVEAIFHEDNLPEERAPFKELDAELAPQCPVITEKKTPLADWSGASAARSASASRARRGRFVSRLHIRPSCIPPGSRSRPARVSCPARLFDPTAPSMKEGVPWLMKPEDC